MDSDQEAAKPRLEKTQKELSDPQAAGAKSKTTYERTIGGWTTMHERTVANLQRLRNEHGKLLAELKELQTKADATPVASTTELQELRKECEAEREQKEELERELAGAGKLIHDLTTVGDAMASKHEQLLRMHSNLRHNFMALHSLVPPRLASRFEEIMQHALESEPDHPNDADVD